MQVRVADAIARCSVPISIDDAIVRHVQRNGGCGFDELAELFVDAPPNGVVTNTCLQVLHQRLQALCTAGRLVSSELPRQRRRGDHRRRLRFALPPVGQPTSN